MSTFFHKNLQYVVHGMSEDTWARTIVGPLRIKDPLSLAL